MIRHWKEWTGFKKGIFLCYRKLVYDIILIYPHTALVAAIVTVWISAWIPARKLSKLTPLEAVKNAATLQLKRKKDSPILTLLFGPEGELAGNTLKAQRRALRYMGHYGRSKE